MKHASMLARVAVTTVALTQLLYVHSAIYSNTSSTLLNLHQWEETASPPSPRQLTRMTAADIACTLGNKRIRGLQLLHGATGRAFGNYLAMCEERTKKPILTCFMDIGVADSDDPLHVVPCKEALEAGAAAAEEQRRLATWSKDLNNAGAEGEYHGTWPKGVVCYQLEEELAKREPNFVQDVLQDVFDEYTRNACIQFIEFSECTPAAGVCNGCKHYVKIKAPTSKDEQACFSDVGFATPKTGRMEQLRQLIIEKRDSTTTTSPSFQVMQLSYLPLSMETHSPICHTNWFVAHEVGHTLGLLHDHQHPQRRKEVILMLHELDREQYVQNVNLLLDIEENGGELTPDQKAYLTTLQGRVAEKALDYTIQPHYTGGEYDKKSIMHYVPDQHLCIPVGNAEAFCDYGDDPNQCDAGTRDDCDTEKTQEVWPEGPWQHTGPTDKDYEMIRKLYKKKKTTTCTIS